VPISDSPPLGGVAGGGVCPGSGIGVLVIGVDGIGIGVGVGVGGFCTKVNSDAIDAASVAATGMIAPLDSRRYDIAIGMVGCTARCWCGTARTLGGGSGAVNEIAGREYTTGAGIGGAE